MYTGPGITCLSVWVEHFTTNVSIPTGGGCLFEKYFDQGIVSSRHNNVWDRIMPDVC